MDHQDALEALELEQSMAARLEAQLAEARRGSHAVTQQLQQARAALASAEARHANAEAKHAKLAAERVAKARQRPSVATQARPDVAEASLQVELPGAQFRSHSWQPAPKPQVELREEAAQTEPRPSRSRGAQARPLVEDACVGEEVPLTLLVGTELLGWREKYAEGMRSLAQEWRGRFEQAQATSGACGPASPTPEGVSDPFFSENAMSQVDQQLDPDAS